MSHQLHDAQRIDQQIRDAYKRGHQNGFTSGLRQAFILFCENHDKTYTNMQSLINNEIFKKDNENV